LKGCVGDSRSCVRQKDRGDTGKSVDERWATVSILDVIRTFVHLENVAIGLTLVVTSVSELASVCFVPLAESLIVYRA